MFPATNCSVQTKTKSLFTGLEIETVEQHSNPTVIQIFRTLTTKECQPKIVEMSNECDS